EIRICRIVLVIPAHAHVQDQVLVYRPIVLDVEGVLLGVRHYGRALTRHVERRKKIDAVRRFGDAVRRHLEAKLRIDGPGILGRQLDVFVAHTYLDGVIAEPLQVGQREVVRERPTILLLDLRIEAARRTRLDERPLILHHTARKAIEIGEDDAVADAPREWTVLCLLHTEDGFIDPAAGSAVLPPQRDALVLVDHVSAMFGSALTADSIDLYLVSVLDAQFQ